MKNSNKSKSNEKAKAILIQEATNKVGRNLLLYQEIEIRLKRILPYLHPESKKGLEAFNEVKNSISNKTLGKVFGEFNKSFVIEMENVEDGLEKYLKKISVDRNELVHSLMTLPNMDFNDEGGCKKIIKYLDEKLADIKLIIDLLDVMAENIINMMNNAEIDEAGKVKTKIRSDLSIKIIY